jgi:hypothetical protein
MTEPAMDSLSAFAPPDTLAVPPPRRGKSRIWQVLVLMILGVCTPPDLYAVNLFFIGCPVHRILNVLVLRYLLNVSLVLATAAIATTLVGVPLHLWRNRTVRARRALFGDE